MKQSQLFSKTQKEAPAGEISINAKLLERAGFVYKNSAGIYSYLPLGWRVIQKIAQIIREEMNAIGGQEMFMPALVERKYLDATGRFNVEIGFKVLDDTRHVIEGVRLPPFPNFVLGWTHEEVVTEIASKYISSYRDLPFSAYQIQTKFRNEPRAKSGLLRGREFMMKDLYSFHSSETDLFAFYETVRHAYEKIFSRCGLETVYTEAAGGDFTVSNTHEFQAIAEAGEDTIFICGKCGHAENAEISKLKNGDKCPKCDGRVEGKRSIEVGNIFPLGTKYSTAFNLQYLNKEGKKEYVVMGSYGIGLGRTAGAIVEVSHDDKGIIWPKNVAPYRVHLLEISKGDDEAHKAAEKLYRDLEKQEVEVLWDDREEKSAGEKFADADLLGLPFRVVVSAKTLEQNKFELKERSSAKVSLLGEPELFELLAK